MYKLNYIDESRGVTYIDDYTGIKTHIPPVSENSFWQRYLKWKQSNTPEQWMPLESAKALSRRNLTAQFLRMIDGDIQFDGDTIELSQRSRSMISTQKHSGKSQAPILTKNGKSKVLNPGQLNLLLNDIADRDMTLITIYDNYIDQINSALNTSELLDFINNNIDFETGINPE